MTILRTMWWSAACRLLFIHSLSKGIVYRCNLQISPKHLSLKEYHLMPQFTFVPTVVTCWLLVDASPHLMTAVHTTETGVWQKFVWCFTQVVHQSSASLEKLPCFGPCFLSIFCASYMLQLRFQQHRHTSTTGLTGMHFINHWQLVCLMLGAGMIVWTTTISVLCFGASIACHASDRCNAKEKYIGNNVHKQMMVSHLHLPPLNINTMELVSWCLVC